MNKFTLVLGVKKKKNRNAINITNVQNRSLRAKTKCFYLRKGRKEEQEIQP